MFYCSFVQVSDYHGPVFKAKKILSGKKNIEAAAKEYDFSYDLLKWKVNNGFFPSSN